MGLDLYVNRIVNLRGIVARLSAKPSIRVEAGVFVAASARRSMPLARRREVWCGRFARCARFVGRGSRKWPEPRCVAGIREEISSHAFPFLRPGGVSSQRRQGLRAREEWVQGKETAGCVPLGLNPQANRIVKNVAAGPGGLSTGCSTATDILP